MPVSEGRSRNAVCICADRNMLIPALFVADAVKSRLPTSLNQYDVLVFAGPSEVSRSHVAFMKTRGIHFRDDLDISRTSTLIEFSGRLTAATLMKLTIAQHLAGEYDRILYLDCDVTIHGDVGAIFSLDTGPYEIAAAPSGRILAGLTDKEKEERLSHFRALGMSEPFGHFNCGVLYIDVRKWNTANLGDRALDYIAKNPELCPLLDEDALNAVLDGKIAELAPIWNVKPDTTWAGRKRRSRPVIQHHMGEDKPWRRYGYRKRLFPDRSAYRLYEAFLEGSPWPDWLDDQWTARDLRDTIAWEIRRITRRLRGKLGEPTAAQRRAYKEAVARYFDEAKFADVEQGLVVRTDGIFQLKPRG